MAEPRARGPRLNDDAGRDGRLSWSEYSARWATHHLGVDPRRSSAVVRGWLRLGYGAGRASAAARLRPGAVTVAGLVVSGIVPLAVLPGGPWLFAAAGLVLLAALADTADGALALITSRATRMGAFYDSVADRLTEAAWLGALWLAGVPGILVATCGALAWLHEYARSRAAAVGLRNIGVVTVAERPTRVIVVVAAFVAGGATAYLSDRLSAGAMTVVLAFWVVLSLLGSARLLGAIRASDRQSG